MSDLRDAWEEGARAHPEIALGFAEFCAFAEPRAEALGGRIPFPADLYLACACLSGLAPAVKAFQTRYLAQTAAYLRGLARSRDFVDEVQQTLAVRLLVGEEGHRPRLAEYSGRGSLEGWVRMAAARLAIDMTRGEGRPEELSEAVESRLVEDDADLRLIKHTYRAPFRAAFGDAIAALPRDLRALLRLHYVEAVSLPDLARMQNTSRSTIIRRLADAREALLGAMQAALRSRVTVGSDEFESLLRMMRSQLEMSVERLLRETLA